MIVAMISLVENIECGSKKNTIQITQGTGDYTLNQKQKKIISISCCPLYALEQKKICSCPLSQEFTDIFLQKSIGLYPKKKETKKN